MAATLLMGLLLAIGGYLALAGGLVTLRHRPRRIRPVDPTPPAPSSLPGCEYYPTEIDNLLLLEVARGSDRRSLAGLLSAFGLSRVHAREAEGQADFPSDLLDEARRQEPGSPVVLGRCREGERVELSFTGDRYGCETLQPDPEILRLPDGTPMAYRVFPAVSETVAVLLQGASGQGAVYAPLAQFLGANRLAQLFVPDLRGHHLSGGRPGDVDRPAQLLEDLELFLQHVRRRSPRARLILIAHSIGAGLAIRLATGSAGAMIEGLVLLAPYLGPFAKINRPGDGTGWVTFHRARALGLTMLRLVGLRRWEHLPLLQFSPPEVLQDPAQTLTYSYRMALALAPPWRAGEAISRLTIPRLIVAGEADEMFVAARYLEDLPASVHPDLHLVRAAHHLGIVYHPETHRLLAAWLSSRRDRVPVEA